VITTPGEILSVFQSTKVFSEEEKNMMLISVVYLLSFLQVAQSWHGVPSFRQPAISRSHSSHRSLMMSTMTNEIFVKYHGLGNDFIIVDNTKSSAPRFTPEDAIKLCDRNFGIGGDGLIFALPGENGCDYTMRIYNSD
jgi:hypothetical protein